MNGLWMSRKRHVRMRWRKRWWWWGMWKQGRGNREEVEAMLRHVEMVLEHSHVGAGWKQCRSKSRQDGDRGVGVLARKVMEKVGTVWEAGMMME